MLDKAEGSSFVTVGKSLSLRHLGISLMKVNQILISFSPLALYRARRRQHIRPHSNRAQLSHCNIPKFLVFRVTHRSQITPTFPQPSSDFQTYSHSLAITMNRLFGAKSNAPKPTLNNAIQNVATNKRPLSRVHTNTSQVDTRIESIDVKLAKLTSELQTYQQRLARMRDGPGKNAIKQKAIKVLQQRKMYEGQKDQLQQQSWNMEQAGMMQDNLKNTMATVDAMKTTQKELRKQYGKVNIDKIEKMQDEMADLMDMGNDIQESISRSYDVPEEVDEAELDAELEALGEEVELDAGGIGESEMPGFLTEGAGPPQFIDEAPELNKAEAAT